LTAHYWYMVDVNSDTVIDAGLLGAAFSGRWPAVGLAIESTGGEHTWAGRLYAGDSVAQTLVHHSDSGMDNNLQILGALSRVEQNTQHSGCSRTRDAPSDSATIARGVPIELARSSW